jgi:moderate conductance mechanosensitive channel
MLEAINEFFNELGRGGRIAVILLAVGLIHLLVRLIQKGGQKLMVPSVKLPGTTLEEMVTRHAPKFATVTSLVVSAITFVAYFLGFGLVLHQFGVELTHYLATASVLGLAIGFGSQGLVQDVVIGLTLLFSDTFHIGDVVEISGQVGRVDRVGLRFTKLVNFLGQDVYVPNRNIAVVSRFRRGGIRAYADIQLPAKTTPEAVQEAVDKIARGMRIQYSSIILDDPRFFQWQTAEPGGWTYLRVRFRLWPGQGPLIETIFRQRVLTLLRQLDPEYQDWMVTVVYRVV